MQTISKWHIKKSCPDCGEPLVIRTNSKDDSQFLGCSGYPVCKHTEPLPEEIKLKAIGTKELPGFDTV